MTRILRTAFGCALGLAVTATVAKAQEPSHVQGLFGGGLSFALSDLADRYNNGPHGLAGVQFFPAMVPVGIRLDGMYNRVSGDEDVIGPDQDLQIFNGTLNAVYAFSVAPETKVRPYLLAGVGVYNEKAVGDAVPDNVESNTEFGINGGAGFDFRATETVGIFLEGRFHLIFDEDEAVGRTSNSNLLPVTLGLRVGR